MLRHELSCPPVRLLLGVLVLKDPGRNHYAIPGVDKVVSHVSGDFADDGYKALIHQARCLARVAHALIPPYRSVQNFCATSFPTLPHGAFVCTLTGIAALMFSLLLEQARIRKEFFSDSRSTEGSNLSHTYSDG